MLASLQRIKTTIGIRYDDFPRVAVIVADMRTMLEQHPAIDATTTLIVNFTEFGPSSLDLLIYTFTRTVVWVAGHRDGISDSHRAPAARAGAGQLGRGRSAGRASFCRLGRDPSGFWSTKQIASES